MVVDTLFKVDCNLFFDKKLEKMIWLNGFLHLLRNLMLYAIYNSFKVIKDTLSDIQTCLQNSQRKIQFLELESQLQWDEHQEKNCDYELVFVHNNTLFELDSNLELGTDQTIWRENLDVAKSFDENPVISKTSKKLWEEITHNKHITSLGYNKYVLDVYFDLCDFSKAIQFWSVIFLDGLVPEQIDGC